MQPIQGKERTLSELLNQKKYTIHYYQREYRWGHKQIEELVEDLSEEFLESYHSEHSRREVRSYGSYFLGSVVLATNNEGTAIVDGQQRLTSITLLLIYLQNQQRNRLTGDRVPLETMIYSEQFGERSFNIEDEEGERKPCLETLYQGKNYEVTDAPESVRNLVERYADIEALFPEGLKAEALPFFIDWLKERVYMVEITANTERDAHKIFVSMNDRGLSLTPTEMLKGYLLAEIRDTVRRNQANDLWKEEILALKRLSGEGGEEDADFIKNWLRAQYAETIRDTRRGAVPEDFDLIGTEFHKWLRENANRLGLRSSADYERFVLQEFKKFADVYTMLKKAANKLDLSMPYVFYNADRNFTLQYQVILSAIDFRDSQDTIRLKVNAVSCYLDQYIARRVFNFSMVEYSTIKNAMFAMTLRIRRLTLSDLVTALQREISVMSLDLNGVNSFFLNGFTKRYLLHTLARMTHFLESSIGLNTRFEDYVDRTTRNRYDIEHIWADQPSRHSDECPTLQDFQNVRNQFGALLLLPRDRNRSLQDKPFEEKVQIYAGENLLARTLSETTYQNNPQFLRMKSELNLPFKSYRSFGKEAIQERQQLYKQIAAHIWNPDRIAEQATA